MWTVKTDQTGLKKMLKLYLNVTCVPSVIYPGLLWPPSDLDRQQLAGVASRYSRPPAILRARLDETEPACTVLHYDPDQLLVCRSVLPYRCFLLSQNLPRNTGQGSTEIPYPANKHKSYCVTEPKILALPPQRHTVMVISFRTDRLWQTVQTQIRLLLGEQSDQGLHCLFHMHLIDEIL